MITNLFKALSKTRKGIADAFNTLIKERVTPEALEMLEDTLITADLGIYTTSGIIKVVETNATKNLTNAVRKHMLSILPEEIHKLPNKPYVFLIVGVNGTGKTTTAAKLANYYKSMGRSVILVGADTYRAAALEQLKIWSSRIGVRLVSSQFAKDPSAVIYDGIKAAQNDDSNIVVVDTAGRIHTHKNLMTELEKMKRTIVEKFKDYSVKTMITIDANLGQNSLFQAKEFSNYIDIDAAILTKMDGTAKGGIVFPLNEYLDIPVEFIGIGENIEDFEIFDQENYVNSIIGTIDE